MAREWFKPGRQTQLAITCTCLQAFLLFGYDQGVFGGLITNKDFLDTFGHPGTGFLGIIGTKPRSGTLGMARLTRD